MPKMVPIKRMRRGELVEFNGQVLAWRKWRKHKGACAAKPKEKKAPKVFSLPGKKSIFFSEE